MSQYCEDTSVVSLTSFARLNNSIFHIKYFLQFEITDVQHLPELRNDKPDSPSLKYQSDHSKN
jgi:hypothetical protein